MRQHTKNNPIDVQIQGLTKRFGNVTAVCDLWLHVADGEFVTLLGPSGSGKTTTLMVIAGFESPTAGDVKVAGRSIIGQPPCKRNIGLVFQNYALFPHMTVYDNIAFPLQQHGFPKADIPKQVNAALDLVKLSDYGDRYPGQLSGGQQQRIALARALVFEPAILLMDEPLGALDRKLRAEMQLEIRRLHGRFPVTTLYITHDQEEALTMSDRIGVLNHGKLEQIGTPEELYEKPANRFVAGFVGETNFIEVTIVQREGYRVRCATEDGQTLECIAKENLLPGNTATIAIRPEKILFVSEAEREGNCLRGVVEERFYLGQYTRYHVRVGNNLLLIIMQQSRAGAASVDLHDCISIGWDIRDATIV